MLKSTGTFLEGLGRQILAGIGLVGRLGVSRAAVFALIKGPPEYCQDGTVTHLNYNRSF